jgi:hypothetical protein
VVKNVGAVFPAGPELSQERLEIKQADRYKPSPALAVELAEFLSAYPSLLQNHKEEIFRDLDGWRDYACRKFRCAQPRKRLGRPPDKKVTQAFELKEQGFSWTKIHAATKTKGQQDQENLREAVRARVRRYKKRTNLPSLS